MFPVLQDQLHQLPAVLLGQPRHGGQSILQAVFGSGDAVATRVLPQRLHGGERLPGGAARNCADHGPDGVGAEFALGFRDKVRDQADRVRFAPPQTPPA